MGTNAATWAELVVSSPIMGGVTDITLRRQKAITIWSFLVVAATA